MNRIGQSLGPIIDREWILNGVDGPSGPSSWVTERNPPLRANARGDARSVKHRSLAALHRQSPSRRLGLVATERGVGLH